MRFNFNKFREEARAGLADYAPAMPNRVIPSNSPARPTNPITTLSSPYDECKNIGYCPVYADAKVGEKGIKFSAYITSTIRDVNQYIDLIDLLFTASEDDEFYIYIDSPGGMISSGSIISSAIHHSKAKVYTIARGLCASAACLIHNAAHKGMASVDPTGILMIHMSSHMDGGVSTFVQNRAQNQVDYVKYNLLEHAIELGILTEDELKKTEGGKEIYITATEYAKRVNTSDHTEVDQPMFVIRKASSTQRVED